MSSGFSRVVLIGVGVLSAVSLCACLAFGWYVLSLDDDPAFVAATVATYTAEAQAAQTATALAPFLPMTQQARLAAKELVFEETFDAPTAKLDLLLTDEPALKRQLTEGVYRVSLAHRAYWLTPIKKDLRHVIAEADCQVDNSIAMCGLAFAIQPREGDQHAFYAVHLSGGGCATTSVLPTGWSTTVGFDCWARKTSVVNHLRLEYIDQYLRFYVNDTLEKEYAIPEPEFARGDVGLFVGRNESERPIDYAEIRLDNFRVWSLP